MWRSTSLYVANLCRYKMPGGKHDCMYLQDVLSGHVGSNPNEWKGEHCWCDACTLGREKGQSNMPEEGESLRTTALSPDGVISARLGRGE